MTTKFIANEDLKVSFTNVPIVTPPSPPDLVYQGDQGIDAVKIVPIKSTKCKANNKFICITDIIMTFAVGLTQCPFTSATYNFVSGGGFIMATAIKCRADNQYVLLQDDTGNCVGGWTLKVSPWTSAPCSCTVKIADAGQTKVKGS